MWAMGILLYFPIVLAGVIFLFGGGIIATRGEPVFLLLYVMFVLVGAGGLMITANLAPIAKDFRVDAIPVALAGITLPALTFAASLDRVFNGLTRPFFGWVSDKIGRENTMFIAFAAEGVGIYALYILGHNPAWFVILSGLVFFAWGEIYSLFPRPAPTPSGRNSQPPMPACSIPRKARRPCWCPIATSCSRRPAIGGWCSLSRPPRISWSRCWRSRVLKPWRSRMIARSNAEFARLTTQRACGQRPQNAPPHRRIA